MLSNLFKLIDINNTHHFEQSSTDENNLLHELIKQEQEAIQQQAHEYIISNKNKLVIKAINFLRDVYSIPNTGINKAQIESHKLLSLLQCAEKTILTFNTDQNTYKTNEHSIIPNRDKIEFTETEEVSTIVIKKYLETKEAKLVDSLGEEDNLIQEIRKISTNTEVIHEIALLNVVMNLYNAGEEIERSLYNSGEEIKRNVSCMIKENTNFTEKKEKQSKIQEEHNENLTSEDEEDSALIFSWLSYMIASVKFIQIENILTNSASEIKLLLLEFKKLHNNNNKKIILEFIRVLEGEVEKYITPIVLMYRCFFSGGVSVLLSNKIIQEKDSESNLKYSEDRVNFPVELAVKIIKLKEIEKIKDYLETLAKSSYCSANIEIKSRIKKLLDRLDVRKVLLEESDKMQIVPDPKILDLFKTNLVSIVK